ncbi:MAG: hypothetical protein OK422_02380 [Thaumarchaeota archaeon]|nr:hypothetical protein [Nitrososphaerota archaeon]
MARTNISVDQAVFDEFSSQAQRQNKTLFAFANESLSTVAKVAAEGGNPLDLYKMWRAVTLLKQIDVITLPSDFIDELIVKDYARDKAGILKMFRDLGSQLVGVLKIAAEDLDQLSALVTNFAGLLPVKQFTIGAKDKNKVEIDVVGAGRRIESTECAVEFLTSVLNGYGYSVIKKEVNVGTIRVWATRRDYRSFSFVFI